MEAMLFTQSKLYVSVVNWLVQQGC